MTKTYAIKIDGIRVATMTADFAQALSQLLLEGGLTPFQVADVHHQPSVAAKMLLDWVTCDMACEKCEDSRIGVEELDCESPTEDD